MSTDGQTAKPCPAQDGSESAKPYRLWAKPSTMDRFMYIIPLCGVTVVYFPRLFVNFVVAIVAQLCRCVARLFFTARNPARSNKRILIITDYMPPQTHGIAIRLQAYIANFRAERHEVIVFSTAQVETTMSLTSPSMSSFDHPNLPSVVNPFNKSNRISFSPGVKLAFFLSAYSWDVVHLVCPSLIGVFVLPICNLRQIPVYCSHHVEIEQYAVEYAHGLIAKFGVIMYNVLTKWPAMAWGTINAAPTFCFLKSHLDPPEKAAVHRIPSGTHKMFSPTPVNGQDKAEERQKIRSERFKVSSDETPVWLMVQRLAPEKGTRRIFDAIADLKGVLVVAGDGPCKESLEAEAQKLGIPAVFLGTVSHMELPRLYRSADVFVTMSTSETYGLTVLEALQCGCPVAIPHCGVFDELWGTKVPETWFYDVKKPAELTSVLKVAHTGRSWLAENPIKSSWKDASDELMKQYEEAIASNIEWRRMQSRCTVIFDHVLRIFFICIGFAMIGRRYYKLISGAQWILDTSGAQWILDTLAIA